MSRSQARTRLRLSLAQRPFERCALVLCRAEALANLDVLLAELAVLRLALTQRLPERGALLLRRLQALAEQLVLLTPRLIHVACEAPKTFTSTSFGAPVCEQKRLRAEVSEQVCTLSSSCRAL